MFRWNTKFFMLQLDDIFSLNSTMFRWNFKEYDVFYAYGGMFKFHYVQMERASASEFITFKLKEKIPEVILENKDGKTIGKV